MPGPPQVVQDKQDGTGAAPGRVGQGGIDIALGFDIPGQTKTEGRPSQD